MSYRPFYENLLKQMGGSWLDFEGLIRDIYVSVLQPGDWVVDVGAHKGTHTFQMAQAIWPNGRVIAVEAVPALVQQLYATGRQYYPHLMDRIDFHECGVSHSEGTATFYFAPEVAGLSGLRNRDVLTGHAVDAFPVNLTTLDKLCAGATGTIRFLKADIEGGEYDALRGGIGTLKRHRPSVVFEHAITTPGEFGYSMEDMLSLWSGLDYRLYDFFGNSYDDNLQTWQETMVGNFLAVPAESRDLAEMFSAVHDTLSKAGVHYSIADQAT